LIGCDDKWFVLPEHAIATTSFASHIWTFLHFSTSNAPAHRARKMVALLLLAETPDFTGLQYYIREKGGHFEHQILTL